jgi:hypothetical protein
MQQGKDPTIMTDQHIPGDLLHRTKVITGLRRLADWLDAHPDVPVPPFGWDLNVYTRTDDDAASRAEVDRIAAILGADVADDTAWGGHYRTERSFGLVSYGAVHVPARTTAAFGALMSCRDCVTPAGAGAEAVTP